MSNLRVAINAQIPPGAGGVQQFLMGLVHALGKLKDGEEEYILVTDPRNPEWLRPYMGKNTRIAVRPWNSQAEKARHSMDSVEQAIKPLAKPLVYPLLRRIRAKRAFHVAESNGFFESLGTELIHFPSQRFVRTKLPSIYNPHDLQHLHFPEFFSQWEIRSRETAYRAGCQGSKSVAVASRWVKEDIVHHYGTEPERIFVIPLSAPIDAYEHVSGETLLYVKQESRLPEIFALYPAQTWPHKNHIRLIEAIALLRDRHDLRVNLICTGGKNDFWPKIADRIAELRLGNQVRFLGFVSPLELRALYQLAQFVVIPTLFEAGCLPMFEAWREGTPVACSTVTSLPEEAGDAALLFEPTSVENVADAVYRMTTDSKLREILRQRAACRIRLFTWERTARMYRALYRKTAGCAPIEGDEALLDEGTPTQSSLEGKE